MSNPELGMLVKISSIPERVVIQCKEGERVYVMELTAHEAILLRDSIGRMIKKIETGKSIAADYPTFINSL